MSLQQWLADVRQLPRHVRFANGDPRGDAIAVKLRDGRTFQGASAVAPDDSSFLLTTHKGQHPNYYNTPSPETVRLSYAEISEIRCGSARWPRSARP